MPTENARGPLPEMLRGLIATLRSWWNGAGARGRWLIAGGGVLAVVGALSLAHLGAEPVGYDWLYEGKVFPRAEAAKMVAALETAGIPCEERGGKVSVPAGRRSEAIAELARGKLGPRPFDDLLDEAAKSGSFWDGPDDRERQERRGMGKAAGEIIAKIPGVVSATVIFSPMQVGTRLNPQRRLKVMALVQTENGQALAHQTIEMIRNVLTSFVDVDASAVTLFDPTSGREYLVAGRPEVEAQSTVRVREEELREKILDQLRIEGARVTVRIDPVAARAPAPEPAPAPVRVTPELVELPRVNQPIGDIADAEAPRRRIDGPVAAPVEPVPSGASAGKATVLVRVPRSHYLRLYREYHPTGAPEANDLAPYVARVGETVRLVVSAVLAPGELAELKIDRIDDLGPARPAAPSDSTGGSGQMPGWMMLVAAGLVLGLVIVTLGGRWLVLRRPRALGGRPATRARISTLAETAAGPGERVRSLVRLDPAAAGGVLHRWIAQGSHDR